MNSSSWSEYAKPDAELQAILAQSPPIPSFADYGSAADLRASITKQMVALVEVGVFTPVDWSGCSKSETTIPTRDGAALRTIVYKPDDRAAGKYHGAVFVYFHGGGWTFGFPEAGESYFESLVKDLGITCVSVGYRLAPENRFPTAVEDAIDAVKWVMANGTSIGGDVSIGLVLSGSSAGGLLAAVVSHVAVDEGWTPALSGLVLLNPGLCHPNAVPVELKEHYKSWEECKDGVILDQRGMKFFYEQYQPDLKSPLAKPLFWKTHEGQPPTYLQVMGADPLRDEALIYEHILRREGVQTMLDVYSGMPHGGADFFPMHSCAKKAVNDVEKAVEWCLELGHAR